jgi:hypothetical protein
MIIIPGLSRQLETVGKHVVSWDDNDGRLSVEVACFVPSACMPEVWVRELAYPCTLSTPACRHSIFRPTHDLGCRGSQVQVQ